MTNPDEVTVGQPTECALLKLACHLRVAEVESKWERLKEIPFSSEQKWMAVQVKETSSGNTKYLVKGAPEMVLKLSTKAYTGPETSVTLAATETEVIKLAITTMSSQGLRVLGLASGTDLDSLVFTGLVGMIDPLRAGVRESATLLVQGGVTVVMVTGDSIETATTIGRHLGLLQEPVNPRQLMSGLDFDSLNEDKQREAVASIRVFYRATPRHKLAIVRAHQAHGSVVAMTGDGVNDAPALKMADIGIAMGEHGTDVAREAADMVLVDDNFTTILAAIEEGKAIFYNIKSFLRFQLSTSVAALGLISLSTLLGLPNPLNPMQILWVNIIMDGPPAQSLGVEPVDPDVMLRPPRDQRKPLIDAQVILEVASSALSILAVTFGVFLVCVLLLFSSLFLGSNSSYVLA